MPSIFIIAITAFLLGVVVGTLLNVVITRLPQESSDVRRGFRCWWCGSLVSWRGDVPRSNYQWLTGRCRACGSSRLWRYRVVQVTIGLLFALATLHFGLSEALVPAVLLVVGSVAIGAIDLETGIIPDRITLPGIVVGFALSLGVSPPSWIGSLSGILLAGGVLYVMAVLTKGAVGGGLIKFAAMTGAFIGWKGAMFAVGVAVLLGVVLAGILYTTGRKRWGDSIEVGPVLAFGAVVSLFWGSQLINWLGGG